jgi:hypothetical protein
VTVDFQEAQVDELRLSVATAIAAAWSRVAGAVAIVRPSTNAPAR